MAIRNCLIRNKLVLRNHFLWPICYLLHKDKELLELRNNFRATKKFLIAKFDRIRSIVSLLTEQLWEMLCDEFVPNGNWDILIGLLVVQAKNKHGIFEPFLPLSIWKMIFRSQAHTTSYLCFMQAWYEFQVEKGGADVCCFFIVQFVTFYFKP